MERKLSEYISLSQTIDITKSSKKIKIGLLSSFTINGLSETLTVKCSELAIECKSYVAGYNQYNQEILDPKSKLYSFSPDISQIGRAHV